MNASPVVRHLGRGCAALGHAVRPHAWRGAFRLDLHRAGFAAPLRVGAAVTLVFVVGGLTGLRDVVGFAALGALISAFCRPDPYPVRLGRLVILGAGITASVGIGATLGAAGGPVATSVAVICVTAGAAACLLRALHIVGPGAVVFVFAAVGAEGYAHDVGDVTRAVAVTAVGAVIGLLAALAPWLIRPLSRGAADRTESTVTLREPIWITLRRAPHRNLMVVGARIAVAGAAGAAIAVSLGLAHPMWATMGAVATMQGVGYHVAIHRGVQRLLGNVGGAVLAAALLALPLGYWGTIAAIVFFQTVAEIASTVNYALTSLAVTPMALLMTSLGAGLLPEVAVDRVLDTGVGILTGIVIAAITISRVEADQLVMPTSSSPTFRTSSGSNR